MIRACRSRIWVRVLRVAMEWYSVAQAGKLIGQMGMRDLRTGQEA